MRIAVTTPTGNVGSRVVRLLVHRRASGPRCCCAIPGKLDRELHPHPVDLHQGDLGDADYVPAGPREVPTRSTGSTRRTSSPTNPNALRPERPSRPGSRRDAVPGPTGSLQGRLPEQRGRRAAAPAPG